MEFKWQLTLKFPNDFNGHGYSNDEEYFYKAQEAFFKYLESQALDYEVTRNESK